MTGKPLRRLLVNYRQTLDAVLFYVLLIAVLAAAVYGFTPPPVRSLFSHYAPAVIAFCLITQTLLGLEPPAVVRPLLHCLIRPGDDVMYRWSSAPGHHREKQLEPRYGRVVSTSWEEVPENYQRAYHGRYRTYVAVVRVGSLEQRVPLEYVLLC